MNNNSSKQVLLSVIGVAILVVAVVGVSFAFFSYTTTGETPNTVQTGTIIFTASTTSMELTNVFPTSAAATTGDKMVATVSVKGETTYTDGIDFVVKAINIENADTTGEIYPTVEVVAEENLTGVEVTVNHDKANALTENETLATGKVTTAADYANDVKILTITAFYDRSKYHITENTLEQITNAGIKPEYVTASTKLVKPADWNALSENGPAYSFDIQINATQANAGRLPGTNQ